MTSHSFDYSVEEEMRDLLDSKENLFLEEKKTNNMVDKLGQEINEKTIELMELNSKRKNADNIISKKYPSFSLTIRLCIFSILTVLSSVFVYLIAKNWSKWGECLTWIVSVSIPFILNFLLYVFRIHIPGIKKIFMMIDSKSKEYLKKKVYKKCNINTHRIDELERDIAKLVEIKSFGENK